MPTFRAFLQGLGALALAYLLLCGVAVLAGAVPARPPVMEPGPHPLDVEMDADELDALQWVDQD